MSLMNIIGIAGSALDAQSKRLNTVSSNLANADSIVSSDGKPYRARQVIFEAVPVAGPEAQGVRAARVVESAAPLRRVYEPGNPAADAEGYLDMPNVNVVEEMVNMISASRSYQTNVELMNTAKQLMLKTLTLGQ
ncbi:MAG TPA: flagellar basal body rod protein FlgC [Rhodocyclaceae bacterium]|nr:flagellar basal body rod protein FlgC [Rhodocyclaceae bacterium]